MYGDGIGASATIKSKSMVPPDARIVFNLEHDESIIETKEIVAPSIMSKIGEKANRIINFRDGKVEGEIIYSNKGNWEIQHTKNPDEP